MVRCVPLIVDIIWVQQANGCADGRCQCGHWCYWVLLANQHIALSEWKRMCSTEIENQNCLPNFVGCTASRGLRLTINNMLSPAQYPNTFFFYLYVATTPYTYQRKYANLVLPKPFKMSPKKNVDIFVFWFCSATWFFEVNFISK